MANNHASFIYFIFDSDFLMWKSKNTINFENFRNKETCVLFQFDSYRSIPCSWIQFLINYTGCFKISSIVSRFRGSILQMKTFSSKNICLQKFHWPSIESRLQDFKFFSYTFHFLSLSRPLLYGFPIIRISTVCTTISLFFQLNANKNQGIIQPRMKSIYLLFNYLRII